MLAMVKEFTGVSPERVMRLGTTSYIFPADIVPNVTKLAHAMDDIELVLFEVDDRWNNLPDGETISILKELAREHDLSFTVHLPIDLTLADRECEPSIEKALRVIGATADLDPYAFVVHLESGVYPSSEMLPEWVENATRSLIRLSAEIDRMELLCIENLENHTPEMIDGVLNAAPVSCCCDIGHFWKEQKDPVARMNGWLPRSRVVHLHGIGQRDHEDLGLVPEHELDRVVDLLFERFSGVLTLEIFNEAALKGSLKALADSLERLGKTDEKQKPETALFRVCHSP